MPSTGGYPTLVTAFDDPVGFVRWSPDGKWLAFNVAPGGGLNEQVYVVRPDGTELRRLTEGGKENNFLGGWTKDSRYIHSPRTAATCRDRLLSAGRMKVRCVWWPRIRETGGIDEVSRDTRYAVVNRLITVGQQPLFGQPGRRQGSRSSRRTKGRGRLLGSRSRPTRRTFISPNKDRDL